MLVPKLSENVWRWELHEYLGVSHSQHRFRILPWVNVWAEAAANVHDLGAPFDEGTYHEYLCWFHGATRVHCFPVWHEAEIIDTFAMEPPTASHALVSRFVNFFVLLLVYQ
jgi:hypothetical protein